jgi:putative intracellular protease/amidase
VSAVHVRLRDAMAEGRIVGAIGEAVVLAAKAGIVARRKVAVPADDRAAIRQAGGIVASGSVAVDDTLVTADGHSATTDFAQALRRRLAAKHGNGGSSR